MFFAVQVLDELFEILDPDEKGELDYGVYMWAVLGNMIEARKSLVRKVTFYFSRLLALSETVVPMSLPCMGGGYSYNFEEFL